PSASGLLPATPHRKACWLGRRSAAARDWPAPAWRCCARRAVLIEAREAGRNPRPRLTFGHHRRPLAFGPETTASDPAVSDMPGDPAPGDVPAGLSRSAAGGVRGRSAQAGAGRGVPEARRDRAPASVGRSGRAAVGSIGGVDPSARAVAIGFVVWLSAPVMLDARPARASVNEDRRVSRRADARCPRPASRRMAAMRLLDLSPRTALIAALVAVPCLPAAAQDLPVDLELVLAVDISGSVDEAEAKLQREGYIAALRHPQVIEAIQGGMFRRIALTYVEWAGDYYQRTMLDWTLVENAADADALADALAETPLMSAHWTSISGAI